MAAADYRLCDNCTAKAFYDCNLNYETGEPSKDSDGMPYTIIGFGNGYNRVDGPRSNVAATPAATISNMPASATSVTGSSNSQTPKMNE